MIAIIPFTFETSEIRSIVDGEGNPWFVGRDIAAALGYVNPPEAIRTHCKKAQPIEILGVSVSLTLQNQTLIIPQSDVIRLIARSKLPAAERFQDWLFEEVVPSIMKTGGYGAQMGKPVAPLTGLEYARALVAAEERVEAERNARLEAESREKVMNERAAEEFSKRITAEARVVRFEGRVSDITFEECYTQMYNAGHFVGLCPTYEGDCKNITSFAKRLRHEFITNGGTQVDGHERFNRRGCIYEVPQTRDDKLRGYTKIYKLTEKGVRAVEKILDSSRKDEILYPDNRAKILKYRSRTK
jgi:prophage antirepressor-like protein